MKAKGIEIAGTVLIDDGPDFCATGPCMRWRCKECDYILYGTEKGT